MHLEGQYGRRSSPATRRHLPDRESGYAMAALLAGLAVMSVGWLLVMPVWKQTVQREKEAELIFRAGQYARAIALYQRKYANAFPPNVDVLLREKMLRKKYKDPITNGDFRYLSPLELQAMPGMLAPGASARPGFAQPNAGIQPETRGPGQFSQPPGPTPGFGRTSPGGLSAGGGSVGPTGGIAAAVSRSTASSIKVFKNRRNYNQWIVTVEDVTPRRGVGIQPGQQPGQPGQPGQQPGVGRPGLSPGSGARTPSFPTRPQP
jgi:type II secretory pathway pseudopilin PulG